MKLAYREDFIVEDLFDLINEAKKQNKKIAYIMLTQDEMDELRESAGAAGIEYEFDENTPSKIHTANKDGKWHHFYSTSFLFDGYPVIVVPDEFQ